MLCHTQMLLFSIVSVMSSSLLMPSISSIGALPTSGTRSACRLLVVTPARGDSNLGAAEAALINRRSILGGATAMGGLVMGGAPERAAAVGWDFDTTAEPLPANRRITSKVRRHEEPAVHHQCSLCLVLLV